MKPVLRHAALAAFLLSGTEAAHAQACISLNAVDTGAVENFDTLAISGTANALALPGWQLIESGGGTRDNELYAADTGSGNTGDTISYGSSGSSERALGALRSGTLVPIFGACYVNNTGAPISALDIAFAGEQWRTGTISRSDRLDFQYSVDAISLVSGTWIDADALDFASTPRAVTGALNGNAAENRTALAASIGQLSIPAGGTVWIRWTDLDASGADDGLAIDDVQLTARGAGGGLPVLTIDDASVAEGDDGVTSLHYTLSLSRPAGTGGVSVRVITADGTASSGSDFDALDTTVFIAEGQSQADLFVVVRGDTTPESDETLTVQLGEASGATVADALGAGTILNDDFVLTAIHEIQGAGATSPLSGELVTTTGIVTGRKSNGFFLQTGDGEADADPATSEGVFVFTGSTPSAAAAVGNRVRVRGLVVEFVPTQDPGQAPLTEIGGAPSVAALSTGHALPAAVPLDATFPSPTGSLEQLERLEGMRVTVPSFTVTAATGGTKSGNLEVNASATSNGVFHGVVTGIARPFREPGIQAPDAPPGGIGTPPIPRWDFNPELISVDSDALGGSAYTLNVSAGTVITGLTGPLDFGFRRYTLLRDPAAAIEVSALPLPRAARLPANDEFTVAGYNLERFFDTVNDPSVSETVLAPAAFERRLTKASLGIREYLHTPDIVAVVEMENLSTLQTLAARVGSDAVAAGQPDPQYAAYLQEGNDIGGIDVGFLVKNAQVAAGVARVEVVSVTQIGKDLQWQQPDGSPALLNDRPPLLLEAVVHYADGRRYPISVMAVHQRSLNDAELDDATGQRVRLKRQRQAEYLATVIDGMQKSSPQTRLVVLGDFNAFAFNDGLVDAMNVVTGTPTPDEQTVVPGDGADLLETDLVNLGELASPQERYSFVFDGNAQTLDHVLVNEELVLNTTVAEIDHARINADFPESDRNGALARLADHDPVVAYFAPRARADLAVTASAASETVRIGQPLRFAGAVANRGPDAATHPGIGFALDAALPSMTVTAPAGWSCDAPQIADGTTSVACNADSLANDATSGFTIEAIAPAALVNRTVNFAVAAQAQSLDPEAGNNQASTSLGITGQADLALSIAGPSKKLHYGSIEQFPVSLRNDGPDAAWQPVLTLRGDAPAANTVIDAPNGWTCTVNGDSARFEAACRLDGTLASGVTAGFSASIRIPARPNSTQYLTLQATATSATPDSDAGDNSAGYANRIVGVP
ncbi:Calx-beta domain-containing protein [Lysobacter niastensis]|uniref:Nuclease n=1 Tax=Lysobacter niastensis TaxID=380629 RepID=A0ABS0B7H1_9GAMM|nr:Calx-beta domain-containing protein [Lysobacter niastensis]MBF6024970.1 nuclease [Lysobacter niastensis]